MPQQIRLTIARRVSTEPPFTCPRCKLPTMTLYQRALDPDEADNTHMCAAHLHKHELELVAPLDPVAQHWLDHPTRARTAAHP